MPSIKAFMILVPCATVENQNTLLVVLFVDLICTFILFNRDICQLIFRCTFLHTVILIKNLN